RGCPARIGRCGCRKSDSAILMMKTAYGETEGADLRSRSAPLKPRHARGLALIDRRWRDRSLSYMPRSVEMWGHGMVAAVERQPWLGVTYLASIDQYTCITAKTYAVLTPNSSIPLTASRAPIICQGRCSVSPDPPRVDIESTE